MKQKTGGSIKMQEIPKIITQDRSDIHNIIKWMFANDNEQGIFPTTETYNKFEELLKKVRIEALGWTWAEACVQLDKGEDPRKYEQPQLISRIERDLNPPCGIVNPEKKD